MTETSGAWRMFGVYVHVPFCRRRCTYCDFATTPLGRLAAEEFKRRADDYVTSVLREADFWRDLGGLPTRPRTIYLGGGTPTLLGHAELRRLIEGLGQRLGVATGRRGSDLVEFTVEANPADLDFEVLELLRDGGVTRLSIGVQSMQDEFLAHLGRDHDAAGAAAAFGRARRAGFSNISVDLIFALPDQTLTDWQKTLDAVLRLDPEHISCYALDLDPHTALGREVAVGISALPEEEAQAEMYEYTDAFLVERGYEHYEISNFAKKGFASKHNLNYWQNGYYLGLGPAAHGHLSGCRYANLRAWRAFARHVRAAPAQTGAPSGADEKEDWADILQGKPGVDRDAIERVSVQREMEDTMIMGLRLAAGVERSVFAARFGVPPEEAFGSVFASLETLGVLERTTRRVRLTKRGWLISNAVLSHFLR